MGLSRSASNDSTNRNSERRSVESLSQVRKPLGVSTRGTGPRPQVVLKGGTNKRGKSYGKKSPQSSEKDSETSSSRRTGAVVAGVASGDAGATENGKQGLTAVGDIITNILRPAEDHKGEEDAGGSAGVGSSEEAEWCKEMSRKAIDNLFKARRQHEEFLALQEAAIKKGDICRDMLRLVSVNQGTSIVKAIELKKKEREEMTDIAFI